MHSRGDDPARAGAGLRVRASPDMNQGMNASADTRRVTANLPVRLLCAAQAASGQGITETLKLGLELVRRRHAAARLASLKGKIRLDLDLEASRERARR